MAGRRAGGRAGGRAGWKRQRGARTRAQHEHSGQPELAVRAQHRERGDVAVQVGGVLLLHLRQHVADDATVGILGDKGQLRPGQRVVHVVLKLVVLGQAVQVGVLDRQQVARRTGADGNHCFTREERSL